MGQIDLNDMRAFRKMLTLNRVRGFINAGNLARFTAEELWQIWDWLNDLSMEVQLMGQAVQKARAARHQVDELTQKEHSECECERDEGLERAQARER